MENGGEVLTYLPYNCEGEASEYVVVCEYILNLCVCVVMPHIRRVHNLMENGGEVLAEVAAHKSQLAILAWGPGAHLLASASTKGTVIRVHRCVCVVKWSVHLCVGVRVLGAPAGQCLH